MPSVDQQALTLHRHLRGKIAVSTADSLDGADKLSLYYTPGVAAVCREIHADPATARDYTWTNNTVAIVSDGSAVLGLGNIGPAAALPVMEGKSMLFKQFGAVNAVPIVIDAHTPAEIIAAVKAIAPSFGGINLEDIAAPICFEVEERLVNELPIPVMHDDQHGTAIVALAGLINAAQLTGRELGDCKIVIVGAGAAGVAIAKLLNEYAGPEIIPVDSTGIVSSNRTNLNAQKRKLLEFANPNDVEGSLDDAISDADIFIGVSQPDLLSAEHVRKMKPDPIIFALSNPDPEISPDLAKASGAAVIATGRSDYPNQVNNALAFPGIFRGALDNNVHKITEAHKLAVADAIAGLVGTPTPDRIIPSIFEPGLAEAVAAVFTDPSLAV